MFKLGLTVEGLLKISLAIGVIAWMLVGIVIIYKFGILERYQISIDSDTQAVLVRNSLTGSERLCSILGCINIFPGEDPTDAVKAYMRLKASSE